MQFKLLILLIYLFKYTYSQQQASTIQEANKQTQLPYLLISVNNNVRKIYSTNNGANVTIDLLNNLPIEIEKIDEYAFAHQSNEIYLYQSKRPGIIKYDITNEKYSILNEQVVESIKSLIYDELNDKLYWLDSDKGTLETCSTDGKTRSTLLQKLDKPISLAFHRERNEFIIGLTGEQPSILVTNLQNAGKLLVNTDIIRPTSIVIDKRGNQIFWSDAGRGTIESISLTNASAPRTLIYSELKQVESLAFKDQILYWTDLNSSNLYMLNLDDKLKKLMIASLDVNANVAKKLMIHDTRIELDQDQDEEKDEIFDGDNQWSKRSMNSYKNLIYDKYNYTYLQYKPPSISINPATFMHSSVRSTEDYNREDVIINRINELQINAKFYKPIAWHFERFNSSNYIMVDQEQMITVWREPFQPNYQSLTFNPPKPDCEIDMRNKGFIIQSIFYTRLINNEQVLHVAFIYRTTIGTYKLRSYEVTGDSRCLQSYQFDLKQNRPIKLDYISTYQFGSLALLFQLSPQGNDGKPRIEYLKSEHEVATKLVKVYARGAIDFEPFIANGFAYLAVAHSTGADIFKFDESIAKHRLYESIPVNNIKDLKSFRIGFKNFLAIATRDQYQHIFTWKSGSFFRYQVLNITNVIQWQVIDLQTCRDDLLLGVVRNDAYYPFLIYTWDGVSKHFRPAINNIRQYTSHNFAISPFSQASFNYNTTAYILEFDRSYQPRILAIYSSFRQIVDPVIEKLHVVTGKIQSLYQNFVRQQKEINYVRNILDRAVRPTRTTVIEAKQKFLNKVDITRSIDVTSIKDMRRAIWQGTSLTLNDTNLDLIRAQNDINQLTLQANNLKSTLLGNAVFKDQPATISGTKVFSGGVLMHKLNGGSTHITKVNNNPLTLLLNDLVYKDLTITEIKGKKIFLSPIDVKGRLDVGSVNGIANFFELAVKKNVNQLNLNSPINFVNGFSAQNLDLTGRINNVNLTTDPLYLDQGILKIKTPVKIIASTTTVNHLNTSTIDGVNLLNLYQTSLRTNGNQIMNSLLRIQEAVTLANVNVKSNKLNQHNLAVMSNLLVRRDKPVQITNPIVFANSIHLFNSLTIGNRLNSLRIPFDLVSKSRPNLIDGIKRFSGRIVTEDNLDLKGLINGVRYPQDVITLSLEEEISSPIVFENGFTTRKNVHSTGRIDGVKMREFANYINSKFSNIPADAQFMGKVFVRNNLIVDGFVNQLNLTSFIKNVVIKSPNSTLFISGPKHLRAGLQFGNGLVKELNDGLRPADLLTTNSNQTVYARLKTAAPVQFDNLHIYNRLINNFDLVKFAQNYISIRKPEFIVPNKRFEQIEAGVYLRVKGKVNGLQPNQDFILSDNVGQINSRVRFTKPVIWNSLLNTGNLLVKGSFSNINLTDLFTRRIRLDTNESLDYQIQLAASTIRHLNLIDQKLINGMNFDYLRANLLHKFGNQTINGQNRFMNLVQFNQDVRSNSVNNISLAYIRDNALRLNGDQIIENSVIFHDDVEVGKLNVGKLLNGIDFSYLLRDGIRYDENVYLKNRTIITAPARFLGNLIIGTMNGLDLNRDVLHKSGYQKVNSNLFVDDLLIKGPLTLKSGHVNGQNLIKFENSVLRMDKPNVIVGNLEIDKSVNVLAGTRVQGMINRINLTKIISNSLFKYGDQRLNYARIANVPTTFKKLFSYNVNGVNIRNFMNEIVFANSPQLQTINSPKRFKKIVMRGNYFLPDVNSICLINGFDLNEMYANRIPINSSQPVVISNDLIVRNNLFFNSDLKVAGKLNNIDLIQDTILLNNRPLQGANLIQNIVGRKDFRHVVFENQIGLKGNLNGANLNELIENTMHRSGKEAIEGTKHFKGRLVFNKLDVFNFNNERNQQSPFLDYRDIGKTSFTFTQPVEILGDLQVTGQVNNISLNALYQDSLRYTKPQRILGKLKFDQLIITKDSKFTGPLNGIDMKSFLEDLSQYRNNERTNAVTLNKKIYKGMKMSRELLKYLEHSTLVVEGLSLHQSLDGVFGNEINLNPLQIINSIDKARHSVQLQFNFQRNLFEKVAYNGLQRRNFTRREVLDDQDDFSINLPEFDSNEQAVIRKKRSQVATIGKYVDQVKHLDIGNGQVLIGSLSAIYGKLELRVLTKTPANYTSYVTPVGTIQVGPMATNFALFRIDDEIYLAVSRSFQNMCPLQDSGSFLFHWEQRKKFKLIQRINLPNANNVIYYNFNEQHYLIFSNQRSIDSGQYEDENLYIYRKSTDKTDCQFVLFQKLPFNDVEEFIPFTFGSLDKQELYLVAISVHKLVLWKHSGHSGFSKYWVADLVSGKTVRPVLFNNQLFFIVAQNYNCRGSYVFRAITKGIPFNSLALYYGQQFAKPITSIPEF